jgi:hypothetical protein
VSTTIAFALLGLAVLAFLAVIGVILIASVVKAFRKPQAGTTKAALNPEDRNLDFLRRKFPDPAVAPVPDLEDLHLSYNDRRKRENERAEVRRRLDEQTGIAKPPNA